MKTVVCSEKCESRGQGKGRENPSGSTLISQEGGGPSFKRENFRVRSGREFEEPRFVTVRGRT